MSTRAIWNLFRILAVVLLIVVLVGLGWRVTLLRDPAYQGKSLTVWLRQFEEAKLNGPTSPYHLSPMEFKAQFVEPTQNAVRHIGTNALPTLLNLVQAKDSSETSLGLIHGRPELVIPALTERLRGKDKWHTLSALGWFGSDAKAAVPVILPLLNDPDQETRNRAAIVLKRIDPEAAATTEAKSP